MERDQRDEIRPGDAAVGDDARAGDTLSSYVLPPLPRFAGGLTIAVSATVVALVMPAITAIFTATWFLLVIVIMRSDAKDLLIPDWASFGIAILGLTYAIVSALSGDHNAFATLAAATMAALNGLIAAAFLWGIGRIFRMITGRYGLGFGDVKLAGASGVWLSLEQQAVALELATLAALCAIGLTYHLCDTKQDSDAVLPFGVFLAPTAWLVFVISAAAASYLESIP